MSIVEIVVSLRNQDSWKDSDCHYCVFNDSIECNTCARRKALIDKENEYSANATKRAEKHLPQLEEYFKGLEELEKKCGITSASAIEWQLEIDGFTYSMDSHNNPDRNVLYTYVQEKDKEEC